MAAGACGAADAVDVVFGFVGYVIVYDHSDVVDVNAAGHDVRGYEDIYASGAKSEHHFVAFLLVKVAMYLCYIEMGLP